MRDGQMFLYIVFRHTVLVEGKTPSSFDIWHIYIYI